MRNFSYKILLLMVFIVLSCNAPNNDVKENPLPEISKYQVEVYQATPDDYRIIFLNRLNGRVFDRGSNGMWFEVQNSNKLPKYSQPIYEIKLLSGSKSYQLVLINTKTGDFYIYTDGVTAGFFDGASKLKELDK